MAEKEERRRRVFPPSPPNPINLVKSINDLAKHGDEIAKACDVAARGLSYTRRSSEASDVVGSVVDALVERKIVDESESGELIKAIKEKLKE